MTNLKRDIAKIKSVLGNLERDYEDKAIFVDYELLRGDKAHLEQILNHFVGELSAVEINEFGIAGRTSEEKTFIEWILIIFSRIEYRSVVPVLRGLFEKYEIFDFPGGWSNRGALYRALMKQNTLESTEFLTDKAVTESVDYLKDQLTAYLKEQDS